ncbi:MAG: hypothetical protein R3F59_37710 [Myxococcota bacterium]
MWGSPERPSNQVAARRLAGEDPDQVAPLVAPRVEVLREDLGDEGARRQLAQRGALPVVLADEAGFQRRDVAGEPRTAAPTRRGDRRAAAAPPAQRRGQEHRQHAALAHGPGERLGDERRGQLEVLEVLLEQRVVAHRHGVDQIFARPRDLAGHPLGDRLGRPGAAAVVGEAQRALAQHVDDADQVPALVEERQVHGDGAHAGRLAEGADDLRHVGHGAIGLGDDGEHGQRLARGGGQRVVGAHLDARSAVDHHQRRLGGRQAHVAHRRQRVGAGGVDELDGGGDAARFDHPVEPGGGELEREPVAARLGRGVEQRGALFEAAHLADHPPGLQQRLGEGGLASGAMPDQSDGAQAVGGDRVGRRPGGRPPAAGHRDPGAGGSAGSSRPGACGPGAPGLHPPPLS